MKTNITRLTLRDFRNHENFSISTNKDIIFIHGRNGGGKTSILEAISLFSPGKGMLGASPASQCRDVNIRTRGPQAEADEGPRQAGEIRPFFAEIEINNSITMQAESKVGASVGRRIKVNDKPVSRQTKILEWCDILWFNAKMQYDLRSSSSCRKFFDRISFYLYPDHASHVANYEKLSKSRLVALQTQRSDGAWLDSLERQISASSYDIAHNRRRTQDSLNNNALKDGLPASPSAIILNGEVERMIGNGAEKKEIIEFSMRRLREGRQKDCIVGQTMFGVHKTKVVMLDRDGVDFSLLSGGQQKILILSLMYIIKDVIAAEKKRNPIILLDEMISFLDNANIGLFLERLGSNSSQIWITNPELAQMPKGLDVEVVELL